MQVLMNKTLARISKVKKDTLQAEPLDQRFISCSIKKPPVPTYGIGRS